MGSGDRAASHYERLAELERFRECVDAGPDLLLVLRLPSGRICDVNRAACEQLGAGRDTLLGSTAGEWIEGTSGQLEYVLQQLGEDHDGSATLLADLVARDSRRIPTELVIKYASVEGEPTAIATARDMTDRFVAGEALMESEAKYRGAVETSSDWIWEIDPLGVYTYASPKVEEFLGFRPEEVVGQTPFDLMRPDEATRLEEEFRSLLKNSQPFSAWENINLHKDGHEVVLETSGVPILDVHGTLQGYRGVDRDITERKESERALRESAAISRGLLDGTPESLLLLDRDGTLLAINETGAGRFDASPADLVGTNVYELFPADLRESRRRHIEEAMETDVPVVFEDTRAGMRFENHAQSVSDGQNRIVGVAVFCQETTRRRQMEDALRESGARLKSIFRAAPTGIGVVSDRVLLQVNERICQMTGYSAKELVGQKSRILYLSDEDFDYVGREKYRQISESGTGTVETRWRRKDGSVIDVLLSSTPIDPDDFSIGVTFTALDITDRKRAKESLVQEKTFSDSVIDSLPGIFYLFDSGGQLRRWNHNFERVSGYSADELLNMHPWDFFEGDQKRYIEQRVHLVFERRQADATADFVSKDGRATPYYFTGVLVDLDGLPYLAGMGIDITERRKSEVERESLISELEARNAELERFTYTVSHDLKSPLITIQGYVGLLTADIQEEDSEAVAEDLSRITNSADKMARLLEELLELSRIGRIVNAPTEMAVADLIQDAIDAVSGQLTARGVRVEVASELPTIYGDQQRLFEVVQNLVENAVKYMGDQADPEVEIGAEQLAHETLVYVQDNGIGINSRYQDRIFGLFDQLDASSEGTGIGLALVKRIVEVHGGRIWVESEGEGKGAKFCFTVPLPPASDV